jgi:hypothetical protein
MNLTASSRHVEPRLSTAKAFGANIGASSLNAGAVGCREHRDQVMQGGEPPLSVVGSDEGGQGSASASRRNAMANLRQSRHAPRQRLPMPWGQNVSRPSSFPAQGIPSPFHFFLVERSIAGFGICVRKAQRVNFRRECQRLFRRAFLLVARSGARYGSNPQTVLHPKYCLR